MKKPRRVNPYTSLAKWVLNNGSRLSGIRHYPCMTEPRGNIFIGIKSSFYVCKNVTKTDRNPEKKPEGPEKEPLKGY